MQIELSNTERRKEKMRKTYYETMDSINENIDFFKHERDYAWNKHEEMLKSNLSHEETKLEIANEWLKIANKMDDYLTHYLTLKEKINSLYKNH